MKMIITINIKEIGAIIFEPTNPKTVVFRGPTELLYANVRTFYGLLLGCSVGSTEAI